MRASRIAAICVLAASVAGSALVAPLAAQEARAGIEVPQPLREQQFPLGVTYEAVSVNGRAIAGDRPALTLDNTFRLRGFAGCNNYSAVAYPLQDQGLAVGPFALTRVQCDRATMERERAFLEAVRGAQQWSLDNGQLVLRGGRGEVRFERAL